MRLSLSFSTRIFLATVLLVTVALGTAAFATYTRGTRIAFAAASDSLTHSRDVQASFQAARFDRLLLISELVASDPHFTSYVAEASGADPFGDGQVDVRSIVDLLIERQAELGFDVAMVLDSTGQALARSDPAGPSADGLVALPAVTAAMTEVRSATGHWFRGDRVFQIAVVPVATEAELAGFLVTGLAMDAALAQEVRRVSGSELVLLGATADGYRALESTLAPAEAAQVLAAAGALVPGEVQPLDLASGRWLASATALGAERDDGGLAVALTSLDAALADFRALLTLLLFAAVAALGLGAGLSYWVSRRVAQPVQRLAEAAQAAAGGDYKRTFAATGDDELARLNRAFGSLLSDLREKGEMEAYLADLAKFLPDPESAPTARAAAAAAAPELVDGAFVALRFARDAGLADPAAALESLNLALRNVESLFGAHGGAMIHAGADRAVALFASGGQPSVPRAVAACGDVLSHFVAQGGVVRAAVAGGTAARGTVDCGGQRLPTLIGAPLAELERLLGLGADGLVAVGAGVGAALQQSGGAGVHAAPGGGLLLEPAAASACHKSDGGETLFATRVTGPAGAAPLAIRILPGMVFGGRYEILSELGAGGMAVVFKARDRELNEMVALKVMKPELGMGPEFLAAMKSEIRLSRRVTHRNVLRIHDFGDLEGIPFISMEYVRGMTLRYLLNHRTRLPVSAGLRIVRQVCMGLAAAHELQVLHKDVKPENVMLEPNGTAKLMDFGIASTVVDDAREDRERYIVGTPRFSPPEQLRGEPLDERADVYAVGVMMYQLFAGRLPYTERDFERLIELKQRGDAVAPLQHVPELPAALDALVMSCIRGEREGRPRNAATLLALLEPIRV